MARVRFCAVLLAACLAVLAGGCERPPAAQPRPSVTPVTTPITTPVAQTTDQPHQDLVPWHGPVEELFVHPLVLDPALAFTSDALGVGFQHYFVTAREFGSLLDQLWQNGWSLVDVHRAAAGTVQVPPGRKPLVLVEDDVNYSRYFDGRGLAERLVLDTAGQVRAELPGGALSTQDVVPMVDQAVRAHPEFSVDGAKGVLALTGYEGLLGEHDLTAPAARQRVVALARELRSTGWTFASHTYGHLDLSRNGLATVRRDTRRWRDLARPLIGPVDILVYPYGARPDSEVTTDLVRAGFPIQLDIDIVAKHEQYAGALIMSRRHVDGFAFDARSRQRQFYDVATVRDPRRPPG